MGGIGKVIAILSAQRVEDGRLSWIFITQKSCHVIHDNSWSLFIRVLSPVTKEKETRSELEAEHCTRPCKKFYFKYIQYFKFNSILQVRWQLQSHPIKVKLWNRTRVEKQLVYFLTKNHHHKAMWFRFMVEQLLGWTLDKSHYSADDSYKLKKQTMKRFQPP